MCFLFILPPPPGVERNTSEKRDATKYRDSGEIRDRREGEINKNKVNWEEGRGGRGDRRQEEVEYEQG